MMHDPIIQTKHPYSKQERLQARKNTYRASEEGLLDALLFQRK